MSYRANNRDCPTVVVLATAPHTTSLLVGTTTVGLRLARRFPFRSCSVPTKQEPVGDRRKGSRGREARRCSSSSRGGLGSSPSGWVRALHPPPSTRHPWNEARASSRRSRSSRTCGRSSTRSTSTARSRTSTASRSRYCE